MMSPLTLIASAAAIAVALVDAQSGSPPACMNGLAYPSYRYGINGAGFPGCPLPPLSYMPPNCYGSNPYDDACARDQWHLTGQDAIDPCMPTTGLITDSAGSKRLGSQLVYIKSPQEWCIILPNKQDPWLRMRYYDLGVLPQSVEAEGLVIAQCSGGYISNAAGLSGVAVPSGGILSVTITTNFGTPGRRYIQMWGQFDPNVIGVKSGNDEMGGQYDSSDFVSCGKEPYSGVDPIMNSPSGPFQAAPAFNFQNYVQYFGNGIYCIRICEGLAYGQLAEAPCSAQFDTLGCGNWGIESFPDVGVFSMTDPSGNVNSTSVSISRTTSTSSSASTSSSSSSSSVTSTSSISKVSSLGGQASASVNTNSSSSSSSSSRSNSGLPVAHAASSFTALAVAMAAIAVLL